MKQKLKFFITLIGFLLPFVAVLFLLTYLAATRLSHSA